MRAFSLFFVWSEAAVVVVLTAERNVHVVSADYNLFTLFYELTVYDSCYHCGLTTAPADCLDFFNLVCVYEHII